jgi:rubrerythrin
MHNDPIVEEVRRIRDEFARQHDYNLRAMFEDLRQQEKAHADLLVTYPPKPAPQRKSA